MPLVEVCPRIKLVFLSREFLLQAAAVAKVAHEVS
jgi:hypothetical protein